MSADEAERAKIIPFYGATDRRLFEIERRCMDRPGLTIARLDELLPDGLVLDVGAGDGFTAEQLTSPARTVLALEPARGMIRGGGRRLPWIQGVAQEFPIAEGSLDGLYATYAYFFPATGYGAHGLAEAYRAVRQGGLIVIVDSAGGDEFAAMRNPDDFYSGADVSTDVEWFIERGFSHEVIETHWRFDSLQEAQELLGLYYGAVGRAQTKLVYDYRVSVFVSEL